MKYENNNKQQLTEEAKQLGSRLKEREVTESKQSQEDELLYIFRISSPIGLFILQDANFVFVNDVFRGVTGGSPDELLGTNSIELVYPDDRSDVRENAIKMLKGESDTPYKYSNQFIIFFFNCQNFLCHIKNRTVFFLSQKVKIKYILLLIVH